MTATDTMNAFTIWILFAGLVCAAEGQCSPKTCTSVGDDCRSLEKYIACLANEAKRCTTLQDSERGDIQEKINVQTLIKGTVCSSAGTSSLSAVLSLLAFSAFHIFK